MSRDDGAFPEQSGRPAQLSEEQLARLIAYVDRELTEEERREVEKWIEQDALARAEYEALLKVDEYLELLPRARARPDLAQRTQSILAANGFLLPGSRNWLAGILVFVSIALFISGAFMFGLALRAILAQSERTELIQDLPALENFPVLKEIKNVNRMRVIERSGLFPERADTDTASDSGQPADGIDNPER